LNRRYASRLKAEIESRIARAEFNYGEFFPDSPRATLSRRAGDAITVRDVAPVTSIAPSVRTAVHLARLRRRSIRS
jgi:hypothetical protein